MSDSDIDKSLWEELENCIGMWLVALVVGALIFGVVYCIFVDIF